jgi:hypothetical protein
MPLRTYSLQNYFFKDLVPSLSLFHWFYLNYYLNLSYFQILDGPYSPHHQVKYWSSAHWTASAKGCATSAGTTARLTTAGGTIRDCSHSTGRGKLARSSTNAAELWPWPTGNKAKGKEDEDYTPWSNTKKDEIFHDADEIKTFGDEALIPTGRLRDLLNHINITTPPKFRIKRVPRPGREEYKAIVEIISGPNVLSRHKGPAFRTTYPDAVADATWQVITTYSRRYHDELRNTIYHLLPQRKRNQFKVSGVKADVPRMLMVQHQDVFVEMSTHLQTAQ